MRFRVQAGPLADFADTHGELDVLGSGMHVLAFDAAGRDQLLHDVAQILLQVLQAEVGLVVRTLLGHDGTGRVMGIDDTDAVLDAGIGQDFLDVFRDIVKGGVQSGGLDVDAVAINFHGFFLLVL